MEIFKSIIGLWIAKKTMSTTSQWLRQLLTSMVAVFFLSIFTAILLLLLTAGSIWLGYNQLLAHGYSPEIAMLIIGAIMVTLATGMVVFLHRKMKGLISTIPYSPGSSQSVSSQVTDVVESFMDGLLSTNSKRRR